MKSFDSISIPSGTNVGSSKVSSAEDEPPITERISRGDDLNAQKAADAKSNRQLREILAEKAYRVVKNHFTDGLCFFSFKAGFLSLG